MKNREKNEEKYGKNEEKERKKEILKNWSWKLEKNENRFGLSYLSLFYEELDSERKKERKKERKIEKRKKLKKDGELNKEWKKEINFKKK